MAWTDGDCIVLAPWTEHTLMEVVEAVVGHGRWARRVWVSDWPQQLGSCR